MHSIVTTELGDFEGRRIREEPSRALQGDLSQYKSVVAFPTYQCGEGVFSEFVNHLLIAHKNVYVAENESKAREILNQQQIEFPESRIALVSTYGTDFPFLRVRTRTPRVAYSSEEYQIFWLGDALVRSEHSTYLHRCASVQRKLASLLGK